MKSPVARIILSSVINTRLYMKIRILMATLMMATLTLTAFPASGTDFTGDVQLKSKVVDDHSLQFQVFNLEQQWTLIELRTMDGSKTYFKKHVIRHNGFLKRLNLESLPNGRYLLTVTQNDEELSQVVVKKDDQIMLSQVTEE